MDGKVGQPYRAEPVFPACMQGLRMNERMMPGITGVGDKTERRMEYRIEEYHFIMYPGVFLRIPNLFKSY